jgi:hypothetical protein
MHTRDGLVEMEGLKIGCDQQNGLVAEALQGGGLRAKIGWVRQPKFSDLALRLVDQAPETLEEQLLQKHFPKDRYFETTTLPSMIEPFAWVLIEHLKRRPMVYPEPDKVMLATSHYQRQNDVYGQYVDENILKLEDPVEARKAHLRLVEIYTHFKELYRDSNPQGSLPSKSEVKEYLIKAWGAPTSTVGSPRWTGYLLRPPTAASDALHNAGRGGGGEELFEE